jgi:hypothetical protein
VRVALCASPRVVAAGLALALVCAGALAHEVRPAYLELRQTGPETVDVLWKVPGMGEQLRLALYVELPPRCARVGESRAAMVGGAVIERWTVKCAGGLIGGTIHIAGLSATLTDVLVRQERLDGTARLSRLTPSAPSLVVTATPGRLEVARTYAVLGVEHILLGIDHLLFVLGLLLIVGNRWRLLLQTITSFTAAHSITLALSALGLVRVPPAAVEAVIALSILFLAAEMLHSRVGRPGLTARAPWVVAFAFGLLHGFGFAGALHELGLPQTSIPLALLLFNVGVEMGQLLFVAAALLVMVALRRVAWPAWTELLPPYAIGSAAAFWLIQRLAAF